METNAQTLDAEFGQPVCSGGDMREHDNALRLTRTLWVLWAGMLVLLGTLSCTGEVATPDATGSPFRGYTGIEQVLLIAGGME